MDFVTVELAGFYLSYFPDDCVLKHMLVDPRARVVAEEQIRPRPVTPIDVEALWHAPAQAFFNLFFAHFWRNDLDFIFLDVGANVGIWTIPLGLFLKGCGHSNRILSFEPGAVFECLERGVKLNGLQNSCSCYHLAISDHTGRTELYSFQGNSSIGSTLPAQRHSAPDLLASMDLVDCTTIDDFVKQHGVTSNLICKIDAEGADLKAIAGMQECIAARLVLICFEFTPRLVDTYADPAFQLTELSAQFVLLEKIDTGFRPIGPAEIGAFVERIRGAPPGYADILALPKKLPQIGELEQRLYGASY